MFFSEVIPGVLGRSVNFNIREISIKTARVSRLSVSCDYDITDNRTFWHIVKPFLSDKIKSRENITLVNNENITSKKVEVANTLNNFFSTIIKSLKIPEYYAENNLPTNLS